MKMKTLFLLFVFICVYQWLNSTTWHIKQDGTGDFFTIQEGINASVNGDTVLVYIGTYYENIDFIGKNITVASLFLTTNDDTYISQTIIDGDANGSTVSFVSGEDETTLLCGFNIQNGSGTFYSIGYYGGGVYCLDSSPIIRKCNIIDNVANAGGGIYVKYSHPVLKAVTIKYNHAFDAGGGIYITHNSAIDFDTQELCNIYLNYSGSGCEIRKTWVLMEPITVIVDTFTVLEPDYYFISSTDQYGVQQNDVTLIAQHAKLEPINADLYVSSDGSNSNSGMNSDEPLQSINYAYSSIVSDSLNPHTIYLADGVYSKSLNDQAYPLNLRGFVSLIGESMENTILDAEGITSFIRCWDNDSNMTIINMKLINSEVFYQNGGSVISIANPNFFENRYLNFENLIFENNIHKSYLLSAADMNINLKNVYFLNNQGGWQIRFWLTNDYEAVDIENMVIQNCSQYTHPDIFSATPIFLFGATDDEPYQVTMKNTLIADNVDNTTDWTMSCSAISVSFSINLDLINCTIGNNYTPGSGGQGQGAALLAGGVGSTFNIVNSIFYGNVTDQIYLVNDGPEEPLTINIYNSLIEGGESNILNPSNWNTLNWLEGNLDEAPLWLGSGDHPYMLQSTSSCIDGGTLYLPPGIELPEFDLAGNPRIYGETIDMGAYEFQGDPQSNDENEIVIPEVTQISNYPNPFNPTTTIKLDLAESGRIELAIYNIKGQKVKTLMDAYSTKGHFEIVWRGIDDNKNKVASGQYFIKLKINGEEKTVSKCILLK
ncbi:MAG: choice-of-anchor Q domain-containing protein [Candidatus Tenebribacter burtonii]|nr:choice-of-anchor Q domain-containing protein [Candidatus Tenebribacter burtonii]